MRTAAKVDDEYNSLRFARPERPDDDQQYSHLGLSGV